MSTPDENQPMRDALQRDATGVPKPDFDPTLHYATIRRIRVLAETPARRFPLAPALATAAAVLALTAGLALWQIHPAPEHPVAASSHPALPSPQAAIPRSSLLSYQTAAGKGDDALFALLDRDARELLPASSPVFNAPLN